MFFVDAPVRTLYFDLDMTQEDKELLLKDLCSRLPYGVKALTPWKKDGPGPVTLIDITNSRQVRVFEDWYNIDEIKPYLRPMSSMTEEEEKEFNEIIGYKGVDVDGCTRCDNVHTMYGIYIPGISNLIDWLLAHHFDYRGLIPMGLALEAKEGMYKTE